MKDESVPQVRVVAFAERQAPEKGAPILLQVYIVNESPAVLGILNGLDSINIPRGPQQSGDAVHAADLIHIDFGAPESAAFIQVASGECVKVTLLLREEQLALLERAKYLQTTVKFRGGGDDNGKVTTALLPAVVHKTNP